MKLTAICSKCGTSEPAILSGSGTWDLPAGWTSLQVGGVDYQLCASDSALWAANLSTTFAGFLTGTVTVTATPTLTAALAPAG